MKRIKRIILSLTVLCLCAGLAYGDYFDPPGWDDPVLFPDTQYFTHQNWSFSNAGNPAVPDDFGVATASLNDLRGGDVEANVVITVGILDGSVGPKRDIALVNASPVIVAAGLADGFTDGIQLAAEAIDSGDARAVLDRAIEFSKR